MDAEACLSTEPSEDSSLDRNSHSLGLGSVVSYEEKRILEPVSNPRLVRTKRTLASLVLGQESTFEAWIFLHAAKNTQSMYINWGLWVIGALGGGLTVFRFLPIHCIWISLLMVPFPVMIFLIFSKDLIVELIREVDCAIIFVLQFFLAFWAVLRLWDVRCVFWACYFPTMCVSPLIDAYPAVYRSLLAKVFFSGMICVFVAWNILLIYRDGDWAPVTTHAGDNLTLLIFYLRHLWAATYHEDEFIMIKCTVHTTRETLKVTEDESGARYELPSPMAHNRAHVLGPRSATSRIGQQPRTNYATFKEEAPVLHEEGEEEPELELPASRLRPAPASIITSQAAA